MAIALNRHHVGQLHAAVPRDPANVVTAQIHEHNVLGTFLGIGK